MFLTLALTAVLAQSDAAAAATVPAELSATDRTVIAAEKAAAAAEKAAEAALRIADFVAPTAATKAEDKKKEGWIGNLGVGLTFITGNSQTLTLTGTNFRAGLFKSLTNTFIKQSRRQVKERWFPVGSERESATAQRFST